MDPKDPVQAGLEAYMSGMQRSFPISEALADSVAGWAVATEEFVVYRGQPKNTKDPKTPLPLQLDYRNRPFFSTTLGLDVAKRFAEYATPKGDVLKITVKPGIRYRQVSKDYEAEILIAADGVAEYGEKKVRVADKDLGIWGMAWPVTYSPRPPKPTGGRRKTRRRSLRRRG